MDNLNPFLGCRASVEVTSGLVVHHWHSFAFNVLGGTTAASAPPVPSTTLASISTFARSIPSSAHSVSAVLDVSVTMLDVFGFSTDRSL